MAYFADIQLLFSDTKQSAQEVIYENIIKDRTQPSPEVGYFEHKELILRKHIVSRVSSYFPKGGQWPHHYPNLNKNMKTYIRFKQHKNSTPKHTTNGIV